MSDLRALQLDPAACAPPPDVTSGLQTDPLPHQKPKQSGAIDGERSWLHPVGLWQSFGSCPDHKGQTT